MTELSDSAVGPVIVLSDHPSYRANNHIIFWHNFEQMRWQTYKRLRQERGLPTHRSTMTSSEYAQGTLKRERSSDPNELVAPTAPTAAATIGESPRKRAKFNDDSKYNPAEEMWLKSNFGSERKFLEKYKLDPENYKHRLAGRRMVRSIILHNLDEGGVLLEESFKLPGAELKCEFMQAFHLNSSKTSDWENAAEIMKSCILPITPQASESIKCSDNELVSHPSLGLSVIDLKAQLSQFLVGKEGVLSTPGGPAKMGILSDKVGATPY